MKIIKKAISLLLSALMLFSVTACGSNVGDSTSSSEVGSVQYSKSVKITDDAHSNYTIVIPDDPLATESHAADELAKYLEMISGANLRIVKEGTIKNISTEMKLISVGETELMGKANLDYSDIDFKFDGFVQKTVDNTLFLCGGESNRSHLYAVYDFLEKLGCKFFTNDFEYIPVQETIYLPMMDVVDVPVIKDRIVVYNSLMDDDYAVKSRLTTPLGSMTEEYGESYSSLVGNNQHNIAKEIVPYGVWNEKHPEWFYLDGHYTMLDVTYGVKDDGTYDDTLEDNPVDIAVETLKQQILDNPDAFYFNCSYDDSVKTPNNPEYDRRAEKYGHSGVLIQFINLVIERLDAWIAEETHPDGLFPNGRDYNILMFAYFHTVNPPLDASGNPTVECADNLCIWVCPIGANCLYPLNDPRQVADQQALIEGWYKLTRNLSIWDYYGHFTNPLYYTRYFTTAAENYKYYADNGLSGFVFSQLDSESVGPHNAIYAMQTYVASKIMWDPYRYDAMELVREYCQYYYGAYGEDIYDIIVQIEDYQAILQNDERSLFMNHSQNNHAEFYPLAIMENGINVIEEDLVLNQNSSERESEKARLDKRLKQFLVILRGMIMVEYSSYYSSRDGYKEWSDTVFNLLYELDYDNDYLSKRPSDNYLGNLEVQFKVN